MLLEWAVVLQVWIGGVAAYHLFRAFELGAAPAWTGAVMFETGSYFASRAEHIDSMMAAAWMPLAWLAVWKLREKLRADWLAVLAAGAGPVDLGRISASDGRGFRFHRDVRGAAWHLCGWRAPKCIAVGLLRMRARHPARRRSVHSNHAAHRIERGEISRGLARHRRRALLAKPGVAGRAESLQHIRHEPF